MSDADYHESEMKDHFNAGRFASARWHCRIWTRMVAKEKSLINDGTGAPGLRNPVHAGAPSPHIGLDGGTGE